ncbi:MAG TPA: OmpH family outer membrane protein [Stellaceae bacterium]
MRCLITRRLAAAVAGAILIAVAMVGPLRAQSAPLPPPVILIVDLQQILQDAKAAKGVQAIINQEYSSYTKEVAQQEDELQKARADLERQRTILAPEAFNTRARDLQQRYDELGQVVEGRRQSLQQSLNEAMLQVKNAALAVIADIVKERKANLVIEKQAVVFEADGMDVTADAVARLDQKLASVPVNLPKPDGEGTAKSADRKKK